MISGTGDAHLQGSSPTHLAMLVCKHLSTTNLKGNCDEVNSLVLNKVLSTRELTAAYANLIGFKTKI
ncbi:hypothetical protein DSO57_1002902 [Entomophthora muscae]|uniref:Uncharacterized protein n=1 Tax=Entomophthora muscae TaxID=34485 RepID=A0ACC2SL99_9FUNG|nr:hypothetical protein DSO57_1002902 [Entomophthora muscae]